MIPDEARIVLVIEDDERTRPALVDVLETMGYTAFSAATAAEGMGTLERLQGNVGIVLCDIHLPDADGRDLSLGLGRRWPKPRFVLMSGDSLDWESRGPASDNRYRWLSKPFTKAQLAVALEAPQD